jgi:hypothetical protein
VDPRNVGVLSRLINWRFGQANKLVSLKLIFFRIFLFRNLLEEFLKVRGKIADNFWRKSSACGNLRLLKPGFRLFQQHLVALCVLAPRVDARLAVLPFITNLYLSPDNNVLNG